MQENVEQQRIPVKVGRIDQRLMVAAPMPGLKPDDVTVEVTLESKLVLRGQLRGALKGVKDLIIDEWSVGDYYRELPLPEAVDGVMANVTYGNGVLVVALPMAPRTRPARLSLAATGMARGAYYGHTGRGMSDLTNGDRVPPQLNPAASGGQDAQPPA